MCCDGFGRSTPSSRLAGSIACHSTWSKPSRPAINHTRSVHPCVCACTCMQWERGESTLRQVMSSQHSEHKLLHCDVYVLWATGLGVYTTRKVDILSYLPNFMLTKSFMLVPLAGKSMSNIVTRIGHKFPLATGGTIYHPRNVTHVRSGDTAVRGSRRPFKRWRSRGRHPTRDTRAFLCHI